MPVNRAQTVTFIYRAAGSPEVTGDIFRFTDLDPEFYYVDAIGWAVANGITNGTSENTFSPEADCTRAQIVTMLYRYMSIV